jgi:ABC-2 type transport system permease protein
MTGLGALFKKELKEQLKTYRFLIIAIVFLFFGLATPLMLKYMPELLKLTGEEIVIEIPPPTPVQSLTEYADTAVQLGVFMAVLLAMGAIAKERESGTAAMTLSKPVGRGAFLLAKLMAISTGFLVALGLGSIACFGYTVFLIGKADVLAFLVLNLLLGLFLIFCLSVTLLFSSLFRSQLAAGGLALAVLIGQALVGGVPLIGDFMPAGLIGWGEGLLSGTGTSAWTALGATLSLAIICLYLAWLSLRHGEV